MNKEMNDWGLTEGEKKSEEPFLEREISRFFFSKKNIFKATVALLFLFGLFVNFFILPPYDFGKQTVITINKGESLSQIGESLKKNNVIRSSFVFVNLLILQNGERKIIAGDYYFDKPITVFSVAERFLRGKFGIVPLRITFPEGSNLFQLSEIASVYLVQFDREEFLLKAKEKEGYLFPDTYLFLTSANADDVISTMEKNFATKIGALKDDINKSGRSEKDIVTMASIIEKEASNAEDRRIISDILWRRLDIGMALQVDSTFEYVNGKNTYELTLNDLKIDSAYNTYKYAGLPPMPISNPGLDSIEAAIYPEETSYLYFLSDKSGNTYYAKTFEEHKLNRERYLDK